MSYTIEVSEAVYKLLNQQANVRNSSLDNLLAQLLTVAPSVRPAANGVTEKESLEQELLKLYATGLDHQELLSLKQILADFFARKAIREADGIWNEQDLSEQTMKTWLNEE